MVPNSDGTAGGESPDERETVAKATMALLEGLGHDPSRSDALAVREMVETAFKLLREEADTGQLKLVSSALKEMRYAYRVFNAYRGKPKISIFGSARTPDDHPDYAAARRFGQLMAAEGWMVITGAGGGIMKAGHEGPGGEASFGLAIRLPAEETVNAVIDRDPKLINFRYFFTRKLMFTSNSSAIACLPGGWGTMDEIFEVLTLMQTGKASVMPIVLLEGEGGNYWTRWQAFAREELLERKLISPDDPQIYRRVQTPEEAVAEVVGFYRRFRNSRFVGKLLVLRIDRPLSRGQLASLEREYGFLCVEGGFTQSGPLPGEEDALELPRISFHFTRKRYGSLRAMIDRINSFPHEAEDAAGRPVA